MSLNLHRYHILNFLNELFLVLIEVETLSNMDNEV